MKKILVLGKTGMLGHMVYNYLLETNKYEVFGLDRKRLNALDNEEKIEEEILKYSPNYVINCIGLINRYTNEDEEATKKINSVFPHFLAYLGIKYGWKLIHISSDCYLDEDTYGKSKFLGEICDHHNLTIRTSIIGPELKEGFGLFHWFMSQKDNVNGFVNVYWDGVTTLQLSKFIEEHIDSKNFKGLIDFRTKNSITKYDLLNLISKIFNKKITINKDDKELKDKRNLNPDIFCLKDYEAQLVELKEYMEKNKKNYLKYLSF